MAEELKPQVIVFHTGGTVISKIEEVGADIGEPDCKLIDLLISYLNLMAMQH